MRRILAAALSGLMALPASALAAPADGLTDLLIEKGVITKDDLKAQQKKSWIKLDGRIQARYTYQENDDPKDNTSEFSIPRLRLGVGGSAFENVEFKVEVDFIPDSKQKETLTADPATGAVSSTKGDIESSTKVSLKDAKVVFTQYDYAHLTVGHFKVPFSRQEITSSGNQQFVNRAEINKEVQGRDVGFMIGDYSGKKMFEYAVGGFNGTKTANKNDNEGFLLAGRIAFNPFGEFKYSESNLEGEAMRISIGANLLTNELTTSGSNKKLDFSEESDDVDTDTTKYGVDLGMKFLDNASIFAEYIQSKSEPEGGTEVKSQGYYVQGGYFVLPPRLEITARVEGYDPDDSVDNTGDIAWTTVGLNYFFKKHDWKVQTNYVIKDEEEDPTTGEKKDDDTLLVQLQVKF
jgi:phosphate-selective porin